MSVSLIFSYLESHLLPPEESKNDSNYQEALAKRDRLLEFDKGGVTHSSIKDQSADWYELENNAWLPKDQSEAFI